MEYKNVLNVEDIDKLVKRLARDRTEHVAAWLKSTFSRWLRKGNGTMRQCVCAKTLNDPITKLLLALAAAPSGVNVSEHVSAALHPVKVKDLEPWAQESLADHELWFWSPTNEDLERYGHWIDYLCTLPDRAIKLTIDHLIVAVAAWDKQLAKQKLMSSLSDGVEFVESPALDATDGYYLVKLLTKQAYAAEGAVMSHCVGGYFGRKDVTIYSLRRLEQDRPCATIEVRSTKDGGQVIYQAKAFANKALEDQAFAALAAWRGEAGVKAKRSIPDDEYDEDEEDDCDEEEDEDDEY